MKKLRELLVISGVPIDRLTMEQTVEHIDQLVVEGRASGRCHQVTTVNADFIVKSILDHELLQILQEAQLNTPDGISLIWSSQLLGNPIQQRVCGSDLVPRLAKLSAEKGYSLFFLGAGPGVALRAAEALKQEYPSLKIAGVAAPAKVQLQYKDQILVDEINATRPNILLVAFGNPKQEKWISKHVHDLCTPVAIGVGGTFNFLAGEVKRAPLWFQDAGLEWLYRTWQEPKRFWERVVIDPLILFPHVLRQCWTTHGYPWNKDHCPSSFDLEIIDELAVLKFEGNIPLRPLAEMRAKIEPMLLAHPKVIADLTSVKFLDSTMVATLVAMAIFCRENAGDFWLAGVTPRIKRMLSQLRLDYFFKVYDSLEQAIAVQQKSINS